MPVHLNCTYLTFKRELQFCILFATSFQIQEWIWNVKGILNSALKDTALVYTYICVFSSAYGDFNRYDMFLDQHPCWFCKYTQPFHTEPI